MYNLQLLVSDFGDHNLMRNGFKIYLAIKDFN